MFEYDDTNSKYLEMESRLPEEDPIAPVVICDGCGASITEGYRYRHENFCEDCFSDIVFSAVKCSCRDEFEKYLREDE